MSSESQVATLARGIRELNGIVGSLRARVQVLEADNYRMRGELVQVQNELVELRDADASLTCRMISRQS
jgi:hypothetical protein